jgi:hypothetical protein
MTSLGGLAASFDGTPTKTQASCSSIAASSGYVGKTFASPKLLDKIITTGSTDSSYALPVGGSATIEFYGKSGTAPASATDGTLLGSISFTLLANESAARTITASTKIVCDHGWARIVGPGASPNAFFAQISFYELI